MDEDVITNTSMDIIKAKRLNQFQNTPREFESGLFFFKPFLGLSMNHDLRKTHSQIEILILTICLCHHEGARRTSFN